MLLFVPQRESVYVLVVFQSFPTVLVLNFLIFLGIYLRVHKSRLKTARTRSAGAVHLTDFPDLFVRHWMNAEALVFSSPLILFVR